MRKKISRILFGTFFFLFSVVVFLLNGIESKAALIEHTSDFYNSVYEEADTDELTDEEKEKQAEEEKAVTDALKTEGTDGKLDWIMNIVARFFGGLAETVYWLLDNCLGITMDKVVLGRIGQGADSVNLFNFELAEGNIYGLIGAKIYVALRSFVQAVFILLLFYELAKQALKSPNAQTYSEFKDFIVRLCINFFLLFAMPGVLDLTIVLRDWFLKGIKTVVFGGSEFTFMEMVKDCYKTEVNVTTAIVFLAASLSCLYFVIIYVSLAVATMVMFFTFPVICLIGVKKKELVSTWVGFMGNNIATPILDFVLLCLPIYVSTQANIENGVLKLILTLLLMIMVVPSRGIVRQILGLGNAVGESLGLGGFRQMMQLANMAKRAVDKGKDIKEKIDKSKEDMNKAKMHRDLAAAEGDTIQDPNHGRYSGIKKSLGGVRGGLSDGRTGDSPSAEDDMAASSSASGTFSGAGAGISRNDDMDKDKIKEGIPDVRQNLARENTEEAIYSEESGTGNAFNADIADTSGYIDESEIDLDTTLGAGSSEIERGVVPDEASMDGIREAAEAINTMDGRTSGIGDTVAEPGDLADMSGYIDESELDLDATLRADTSEIEAVKEEDVEVPDEASMDGIREAAGAMDTMNGRTSGMDDTNASGNPAASDERTANIEAMDQHSRNLEAMSNNKDELMEKNAELRAEKERALDNLSAEKHILQGENTALNERNLDIKDRLDELDEIREECRDDDELDSEQRAEYQSLSKELRDNNHRIAENKSSIQGIDDKMAATSFDYDKAIGENNKSLQQITSDMNREQRELRSAQQKEKSLSRMQGQPVAVDAKDYNAQQRERSIRASYANVDNFEEPEYKNSLSHAQLAEFYEQRAKKGFKEARRERAVNAIGTAGSVLGAIGSAYGGIDAMQIGSMMGGAGAQKIAGAVNITADGVSAAANSQLAKDTKVIYSEGKGAKGLVQGAKTVIQSAGSGAVHSAQNAYDTVVNADPTPESPTVGTVIKAGVAAGKAGIVGVAQGINDSANQLRIENGETPVRVDGIAIAQPVQAQVIQTAQYQERPAASHRQGESSINRTNEVHTTKLFVEESSHVSGAGSGVGASYVLNNIASKGIEFSESYFRDFGLNQRDMVMAQQLTTEFHGHIDSGMSPQQARRAVMTSEALLSNPNMVDAMTYLIDTYMDTYMGKNGDD